MLFFTILYLLVIKRGWPEDPELDEGFGLGKRVVSSPETVKTPAVDLAIGPGYLSVGLSTPFTVTVTNHVGYL